MTIENTPSPVARTSSLGAYVFLIITTMSWGGNAVAGKMAVGHISPFLLTAMRWSGALLLITAISVPQIKRDWPLIRQNWLLLILLGAFGFSVFNGFLYSGLQYTSAINAVILQASVPMFIFIGTFVLFRKKASWAQIFGFMLTLLGVAIVATGGDPLTLLSLSLNRGDVLLVMASLVYAGYTVGLGYRPKIHWKSMMAATAFGATLAAFPMLAFEASQRNMIMPDMTGWLIVLYTVIMPSLVAQIFFIRGVAAIGPNRAGLFVNLVPIFGTLFSVLIIAEPVKLYHIMALVLVIGGIIIAERGRPKD